MFVGISAALGHSSPCTRLQQCLSAASFCAGLGCVQGSMAPLGCSEVPSRVALRMDGDLSSLPPVNPCCYYPCQHLGVCVRVGLEGYECDCTRTGYFGANCTSPELWTRLRDLLKPSPAFYHFVLTHFRWFWDIINSTFIRDTLMRLVLTVRANLIPSPPTFNSHYGYISWEAYANVTYYTRILPPVPEECPTPMGTKGKKQLPDAQLLAQRFLLRHKFEADPRGTNLMFAFFAQHFTHQFFKTSGKMGRGFTKALGHGVDLGHLYGDNLQRQHQLRLFQDGKLKFQVVKGEVYPPSVTEVPVHMVYPPAIPKEKQLAMGQEVFGLLPGLCMYATLWLREHNRVCDILKQEHPTWSDEQLFQTARLILIGETIKIVIEDYVQHLSGYFLSLKFDPELLFEQQFQYRNRIAVEFNQLYHWHGLMPDSFTIRGQEYSYEQFLYNTSMLMDYGIEALVESFSRQAAGRIGGGQNINANVLGVAVGVIEESRQLRLQPFNEYRKRFGLKPYVSFQELTGEEEKAAELEELYGDIDALEFYPGLLLEKPQPNGIFGESMVEIGAPFSLKGLLGNPICSPEYWKPSTFGGATGFEIVKTASLEKLVCLNVKKCPYVAFRVPDAVAAGETDSSRAGGASSTEL
ncbi:prostaglandin G/H synthase 1 isoform X1 [Phasianus colchicus]|uniref:prostaglandin G/H synthase 1 isoform X1 n=1 Tax=Phasianus colchicus TaxID=9054 RepID=UPI00129D54A8|nr:prostaglandin G/H synthase 1 isoform X1 [Phasianus colchicus]XP_031457793.1 prostaglandin G/H synthase 1 isoform X1 [Phasianus colchicus]